MRAKIVSNELEEKGYTQTKTLPPPRRPVAGSFNKENTKLRIWK